MLCRLPQAENPEPWVDSVASLTHSREKEPQAMLATAAPAPVSGARRRLTPPRWRWLGWVCWWLAIGEDSAPGSRRLQMETKDSAAAPGTPSPAHVVDMLFQQHARSVLAYLVYRLPSLPDAEDALNDVFLAALNACVSGRALTGGWLMVTAQRRIADFYRGRQRVPQLTSTDAANEQSAGESSEPEWVALRGEAYRDLMRLVARLPQDQQEVLALRFAAGLPSPEIGEVVGKRADAVRALLARAMRRLREEWTR
jgi:RNA polymerase sigma-70 factor, ECF subfamily